MARIENTTLIRRNREDVFDYLSDPTHELEWNPSAQVMEKLTPGPLGVGTRFRAKWKQSRLLEMECTRFDRPNQWQYVNGGPITVTLTVRLRTEGDATRVETSFDAHPRGWFRLAFPIFLIILRRDERANMERMRRALEAGSGSPAPRSG